MSEKIRVRLIGQRAVVGYGADTDLMVDGGAELERRARALHSAFQGSTLEHMRGPFVPGGDARDRFRVVTADESVDVIVVAPDEYDYVSAAYDRAAADRDRYAQLRQTQGKLPAYQAYGIALTPRAWKRVE